MKTVNLLLTGLLAFGAASFVPPAPAEAQNVLNVMRGSSSAKIKVAVNRAIVMESDQPFAELSVANPGIADIATLSDRSIYVLGKAPGSTTLTLLAPDGTLITNVEVRVAPDLAEFKERLREILPQDKIEVRTANDGIVLSGRVSGKQAMQNALELAELYAPEKVRNLMTIGGSQQVMLKVRFAEMRRDVAKRLDASLGLTGNDAFLGSGVLSDGSQFGALFDSDSATVPSSANPRQGQVGFGVNVGTVGLGLFLEALETKGLVRTLAEPNLVALSGSEASFLAGGEYPIPVNGGDGQITVEYKEFGIKLTFKPTVVQGDLINLHIASEVSDIDTTNSLTLNNITVTGFSTRKANTAVELRDGQSMSIAGLLTDNFTDLATQVPWLGDVPVLGALFRSANYNREQTELVIIVTPHLVSPVDGDTLTLPTDRVLVPNEKELFLLGNVAGAKTRRRTATSQSATVTTQDYTGAYGYVME